VSLRKTPVTVGEHQQLGLALARMRDELLSITVWLGGEHLPKNHAIVNRLGAARKKIDEARSVLENVMYDHHDGQPGVSTEVYYPDQDRRQRTTG
jgi:hypothetical protein